MKRAGMVHALLAMVAIAAAAQPSTGVTTRSAVLLPIGATAANYTVGLAGQIEGLLTVEPVSWLAAGVGAGYAVIPIDLGQEGFLGSSSLGLVRGSVGFSAAMPVGNRFTGYLRGSGGAYLGVMQGESSGSAPGVYLGGGSGVRMLLSPAWALELAAGIDSHLGLYTGVSFSLAVTRRLSGPGGVTVPRADFVPGSAGSGPVDGYIRFSQIELERVFPVLYKYYDEHPIGRAVVHNDGNRPVTDVEVRFGLRQFMDLPKVSARIEELGPGESEQIDLYALFTEQILGATEGAKVAGELSASYRLGERSGADAEVVTLDTYERNAMRWDDDRKVAAFVTARDDEVQRFARNVASVADEHGVDAIDRPLRLAIAVLAALDEHRCTYVVDPSSPYAELSSDAQAVDSIQFPRQTLQFRAGDCDDLSATFNALMESVGVATAFITVPGHIYTAFKLNLTPAEAARAFARPGDTIRHDDEVWIPVETTLLGEGFMAAWAEGARAWREHSRNGQAQLFTTQEAWQLYDPVAFGVSDYQVDLPLREDLVWAFETELDRFVSREIAEQEERYLERLQSRPDDGRTMNRLGVLYARYGRYEQARQQFREAAQHGAGTAALVNLGNLAYLQDDLAEARQSYQSVLDEDDENAAALLGLARIDFAEEDYQSALAAHERLTRLDPALAERFSHLGAGADQSGRAADVTQLRAAVVWEE